MKKICQESAHLQPLIDDELSDDKKRFIENHLSECELCQAEQTSLLKLSGLLKELDDIELSADFNRSFWKKVDEYEEKKRSTFFWGKISARWRMAFVPLLIVLVLISGVFTTKKPFTSFSLSYDDIVLVDHIEFLDDFDMVNNLDLIENMDVLNQMKEAS